jgi:hemolysin activation/secretion protein
MMQAELLKGRMIRMGIPNWKRGTISLLLSLGLAGSQAQAQPLPSSGIPASPLTQLAEQSTTQTEAPPPVPGAGTEKTLKVDSFAVQGNTLLTDQDIRAAVGGFEGRDLTLAEMKEAAARLTDLYRRKGYLLVRAIIPKQSFASNTVTIQVLEGKVGSVTIEGGKHYSEDFIKNHIDAATMDGNFQVDRFQRQLLILNEYSDLSAQAVLRPGSESGTADIVVKVEDDSPIHFGLDYNNWGIPETGEHRFGATFDAGNIITDGDAFRLRGVLQTPTDDTTTYFQVRYDAPINVNGTRLGVEYQRGDFSSGDGLAQILDVRGDTDIISGYVTHALIRSLNHSSDLGLTISSKNVNNHIFGNLPLAREDYLTARLDYKGDWRSVGGRSLLAASLTKGFGGDGGLFTSNPRASDDFTKINLDAMRIQNLGTNFYGMLRASGQIGFDSLYSMEQFMLGGISSVRGYSQAELLGDSGYAVTAELRWSPIAENPEIFQVVTFIDHGGVSIHDKFPGELPVDNLTGAGFGFRSSLNENTHLTLDIGFPISPSKTRRGDSAVVYGGIQTRF